MATAYDSDIECCTESNHGMDYTITKKDTATFEEQESRINSCSKEDLRGSVTCSFYPKTLCCTYSTLEEVQNGNQESLASISNFLANGNHDDHTSPTPDATLEEETATNIVTILSEYYSFVEHIKQELKEQNKPIEQVRLVLQYLPCLRGKPGKQLVFSQLSSLAQSTDIEQLLSNLGNVSSWYNHGLLRHLWTTAVKSNTQIDSSLTLGAPNSSMNVTDFDDEHNFLKTVRAYNGTPLSCLPTVSTGPQLNADFEEIKVTIVSNSTHDAITLKEAMLIHETLAEILGLRTFIVLFQGVSEKDGVQLELAFWIPKLVASSALTSAYQNEFKMRGADIVKIQARYETITTMSSPDLMRESGYDTCVTRSNTTDDDIGFLSHSDKALEDEDEVFISTTTQVASPDSSSGFERVSSEEEEGAVERHSNSISIESYTSSNGDDPSVQLPNDVTGMNDEGNCHASTSINITSNHDNDPVIQSSGQSTHHMKHIHLDSEILQEIDRQNSISSPLENSSMLPGSNGASKTSSAFAVAAVDDQDYVPMKPATTPIRDLRNSILQTSPSNHTTPPSSCTYSVISSHVTNPVFQSSPPLRSRSLKLPSETTQKYRSSSIIRTGSYHHYKNIPTSFVRILHDNTPTQSINYRIVPGRPSGFIKRVLSRSTTSCPANLQMVVISDQESDKEKQRVMVESGERVLGLYLFQEDIVVQTIRGERGRVPYSSCRISKAFYGSNSKLVKYSSLSLYTISTTCIELCVNPGHPSTIVPVNMIVVKQYKAAHKDEQSVNVGDQVRVLYCDNKWVYVRQPTAGSNGFIPRECCRLTRKSIQILTYTRWLLPSLLFQSDFIFNLHEQPPEYLLMHPLFPNRGVGTIVMVTRNYTPPGTQAVIRKGVCVKAVYVEDHFVYVATINGTAFWMPIVFTAPAPKVSRPPMLPVPRAIPAPPTIPAPPLSQSSKPRPPTAPVYASLKFNRQRAASESVSCSGETEKGSPKKRVSFASKNHTIFRNSMGSNPELHLASAGGLSPRPAGPGADKNSMIQHNDQGYALVPPRRASLTAGSHENIPVYLLFGDNCQSPVQSSFCGCFKF